jgi:hypothetical protein
VWLGGVAWSWGCWGLRKKPGLKFLNEQTLCFSGLSWGGRGIYFLK